MFGLRLLPLRACSPANNFAMMAWSTCREVGAQQQGIALNSCPICALAESAYEPNLRAGQVCAPAKSVCPSHLRETGSPMALLHMVTLGRSAQFLLLKWKKGKVQIAHGA